MTEIAAALEALGFATFLPHRDGLEFRPLLRTLEARGIAQDRATVLWNQGIFALDAFSVLVDSQALVLNMNGRVPDEGAPAATPSNKYLGLGAAISAALHEDSLEKVADAVLVFAGN